MTFISNTMQLGNSFSFNFQKFCAKNNRYVVLRETQKTEASPCNVKITGTEGKRTKRYSVAVIRAFDVEGL